ncbi:Selenocysteine lyase/Cysteine desulfurase [Pseudarcicella hirudinis]|uniref:Selenocysteine lyase/Cysteine desulfurase n=2 Tax=Pseudarcicella hirudinis TaxID=1079859 RepID=A0A1I5YVL6_9BACT|nr:Selenocysteine lyase/Cysteine desulfurase [Pseudarcicella hirudinis]
MELLLFFYGLILNLLLYFQPNYSVMPDLSKRQFLKVLSGITAFSQIKKNPFESFKSSISPLKLAEAEDFWLQIRKGYPVTNDFIQLENGYYSLTSTEVLEKYKQHLEKINSISSYYMRTQQVNDKLESRKQLAELLGCSYENLIITRNTTESLDTIIAGIEWQKGDEAVMAEQDYGAMLDMFSLQAKRHGMVNKIVSIPNHPQSDEEIVEIYEKAITPKTRLLMVCHMINVTGHILPVKKIVEMAHKHNVEVMVDGAHAFAQIDFKLADLGNCDYYGSSLHKWLGTPLGAGILYVRKDKIQKLWQIYGDFGFEDSDIRKLNHTGTHPVATDLAIRDAIQYYRKIGASQKEARLRYLQNYWTEKVRKNPKIIVNTPLDPKRHCAIANVGVEGKSPKDLAKILFDQYRIFTVAIDFSNVHGVRVTPHIFTTTAELDLFVKALHEIAG